MNLLTTVRKNEGLREQKELSAHLDLSSQTTGSLMSNTMAITYLGEGREVLTLYNAD